MTQTRLVSHHAGVFLDIKSCVFMEHQRCQATCENPLLACLQRFYGAWTTRENNSITHLLLEQFMFIFPLPKGELWEV